MHKFYVALLCCFLVGCTYVEPGYVGIKVNSYGNQRGVEDFPIITGRIWYNPFTQAVYEYPTFMQNATWEDIGFNSSEGAQISASVAINYSLLADKVPAMFVAHRQSLSDVTQNYVKTKVRDAFNRGASTFKAVDIVGEKKQNLLDRVREILNQELSSRGFVIDGVSFVDSPRGDDRVMSSINNVIEATQRAIEAENQIRKVEAEAKQAIEKASGEAKSKIVSAQAEAEANLLTAKAQAEANRLITESLNSELIFYRGIERWDGKAPTVVSDNIMPMIK